MAGTRHTAPAVLSGLLCAFGAGSHGAQAQSSISGYVEVTDTSTFAQQVTFAPGTHLHVIGGGTIGDGTISTGIFLQGATTISTTGVLTIQQIAALPQGQPLRFGLAGQAGTIQVEGFGSFSNTNPPLISVDGGTLEVTRSSAAQYFAFFGPVNVASGAALDFGLQNATLEGLSGGGQIGARNLSVGPGTFNGLLNVGQGVTVTGDLTLNGTISGAETVTVSTGGRLTLTASGALETSAALVINGTLNVGTGQSAGSLAGSGAVTIAPGVILSVGSDNTSTTYSGTLSGAGSGLTKLGTGTLTLEGTGSYTGETRIEAGTLAVSGGSAISDQSAVVMQAPASFAVLADETIGSLSGNGTVVLTGNLTTGSDNTSRFFTGGLSGAGGLIKTGTGTFILAGVNTNAGGVAVNDGILQLQNGQAVADTAMLSATGSGTARLLSSETVGAISGNGIIDLGANTLTVAGTALSNFSGVISGTGGLVKTGTERLVLSGANTFAGPIQISAGTIEIGNGGTTGSIAAGATITNDATLVVNRSNDLTLANRIEGSGHLVKRGAGTLTLDNNANSYTGGIEIQGGTLAGNTLAIRGDIVNEGTLSILDIGSNTFSGVISGSGNVVVDGADRLTLAGANTFSGGLTIKNGKAVGVASDANLGAAAGALTFQAGTLATNASFSSARSMTFEPGGGVFEPAADTRLTLTGLLSGAGGLRKRGPGVLEIAGTGTYAGTSFVDAGTLVVNGTLGSAVSVESGGRLGGSGTIGGLTLQNLATLAPGNSIGTLSVNGAASFGAGSTYAVEVNAAGRSDRLVATGAVTIDPAAQVSVAAADGTYALATTYTIASGASVTGAFAGPVASNLAFLDASLSYDPTNVLLTLTRNDVSFTDVGQTPNEVAVGGALGSLPPTSPIANTIVGLSAEQARHTYNQLSGEAHAAIRMGLLSDASLTRGAVLARMGDERTEEGAEFWSTAIGNLTTAAASPNHPYAQQSLTGGVEFGVDRQVDAGTLVGAVVGSSVTNLSIDTLGSSVRASGVHAGIYGAVEAGPPALRGGAVAGLYDMASTRKFDIPGQSGSAVAAYTAGQAQVFGELAYQFLDGPSAAEAYLGLSHAHLSSTSFAETGSPLALSGRAGNGGLTMAAIGLRSETQIDMGEQEASLGLGVALRAAVGNSEPGYQMQLAGSTAFDVRARSVSSPELVLDVSFDTALSQTTNARFGYQATVGGSGLSQSAKATLSMGF